MFDLCSQIKYLPQPIQSHTNQIISRIVSCVRTLLRMFWMFIPLNLLTQPRPQTLEEAWRESWGSWSEESSFTPHGVRIQDDSWLWPPLCWLPLATCLNRPNRRLQRKGVNCKPFHANFETHFLHTHHSSKIIHGICSIFSYSAGTRPYSNQNTKRFQFGSVAFSVLLASCSALHIQIPRPTTCLFFSQDRAEACNRIVQTQAGWQQQGVNWYGQQILLSMEFQAAYRVTPEYCAFLSSGLTC